MTEIYKSVNQRSPKYMWEYFIKKDIPCNLRTKELCQHSFTNTQRYGINSLSLRGNLLWKYK